MNAVLDGLRALGPARLAAMGGVALGLLALLAVMVLRAGSGDQMALLYGDLDGRDASQIVEQLNRRHIPYKLNNGGTQILVPADQVPEARVLLAKDGLPSGGSIGYELFDRGDGYLFSSFQQKISETRALEGELSRTIRAIHGIRQARVHLVLPRREAFVREQQDAQDRALLKQVYGIKSWDIPSQYLCPPIPGRADHLHFLADLLADGNGGVVPSGESIRILDIGVGANCIYPLIGQREYGWQFVGTDIDVIALANAQSIVEANGLNKSITLRLQSSASAVFQSVVKSGELFDLSMCNPPFHASLAEARSGTQRKWKNLGVEANKKKVPVLNFGGQSSELCCEGGEEAFVCRMIEESLSYHGSCLWFSTLISKSASLPGVYRAIKNVDAVENRTIEMAQGQKKSRIVAWSFFDRKQQAAWRMARRK